jgi:hypothetical protein
MSNNKQSSVDWLIDKLIEHQIIKVGQTTYGGKVNYKHEILFEQAKAMHEEEIINAHTTGYVIGGGNGYIHEPEQYYNETFGGKK